MEFLVENKLFRVDKTVVTIRKEQPSRITLVNLMETIKAILMKKSFKQS